MRKFQIIAVFLFTFLACEDRTPEPAFIPSWLESRIKELEASDCIGCSLTRTTYNSDFYYHVYCNKWSCTHCEVYRLNGNLVDWAETDFNDYLTNQTNPVILWECNTDSKSN